MFIDDACHQDAFAPQERNVYGLLTNAIVPWEPHVIAGRTITQVITLRTYGARRNFLNHNSINISPLTGLQSATPTYDQFLVHKPCKQLGHSHSSQSALPTLRNRLPILRSGFGVFEFFLATPVAALLDQFAGSGEIFLRTRPRIRPHCMKEPCAVKVSVGHE